MKKLLAIMFAFYVATASCYALEKCGNTPPPPSAEHGAMRAKHDAEFEKRLNLTEEQKIKARQIRKAGHEKLKPVMDEIRAKRQEAKMIKLSRMAVQMQEEKLAVIDEELKVLQKKAHEIRRANMKEFESILTREQRRTLKEMKKEGKKRFEEAHKKRGV